MTKRRTKKVTKKRVSKAKTPPFPAYPDWSEAKFWGFIRAALRNKFMRWPPKWEVLAQAHRPYEGSKARAKHQYQCAECQQWFMQAEVEVDHIVPCGSLRCYADLPGFVERMFTGVDGLRVVCKPCHRAKTKESRSENTST